MATVSSPLAGTSRCHLGKHQGLSIRSALAGPGTVPFFILADDEVSYDMDFCSFLPLLVSN